MECEFQDIIKRDTIVKRGDQWVNCFLFGESEEDIREIHIVPIDDNDGHSWGLTCHCKPEIEYTDPETGEKYDCPIIIHHAFDGRHIIEQVENILHAE